MQQITILDQVGNADAEIGSGFFQYLNRKRIALLLLAWSTLIAAGALIAASDARNERGWNPALYGGRRDQYRQQRHGLGGRVDRARPSPQHPGAAGPDIGVVQRDRYRRRLQQRRRDFTHGFRLLHKFIAFFVLTKGLDESFFGGEDGGNFT